MDININLLIIILHLPVFICNFNLTDSTQKIKYVLENFKKVRCRRCIDYRSHLGTFLDKTMNLYEKSEKFGTFLKALDVNDCTGSASEQKSSYLQEHILNGLLLHTNLSDSHWEEYKSVFNKQYFSPHHEIAALEKWRRNLQKVVQHNKEYLEGKQSYSLNLNLFGDMHVTDYFRKILKLINTIPLFDPAEDFHRTAYRKSSIHDIPKKRDYHQQGYKPLLEEQWQCGACYAFAVTHAVQAQLFLKHGDWRELSPQQIVDCSIGDGNLGCDGGSLRASLRYITRAGLIPERWYPYRGKRGRCHYNPLHVSVRPRRWAALPRDEAAIERALATIGPLPVGVNAAPFTFQLYS